MNSTWAAAGSNSAAFRVEFAPGFQTRRWQPRCRSSASLRRMVRVSLRVPGGAVGCVQGVELLPAGRQPLHLPPDLPQLLPPAAGSPTPGLCRDARRALLSACRGSRNTPPSITQALVTGTKATAPAPRMRLGRHTLRTWGLRGQNCGLGRRNRPWTRRGRDLGSPGVHRASRSPAPSWQHAPHSTSTDRADGQVRSAGGCPDQQHLHPTPTNPRQG